MFFIVKNVDVDLNVLNNKLIKIGHLKLDKKLQNGIKKLKNYQINHFNYKASQLRENSYLKLLIVRKYKFKNKLFYKDKIKKINLMMIKVKLLAFKKSLVKII